LFCPPFTSHENNSLHFRENFAKKVEYIFWGKRRIENVSKYTIWLFRESCEELQELSLQRTEFPVAIAHLKSFVNQILVASQKWERLTILGKEEF
jgi:hypothetical protein